MNLTLTVKQKALKAVELLKLRYPDAVCSLNAEDPFQLIVATRLSAQCTDARVNLVTPALFEKYPDVHSMSQADLTDVEELIRPCGFFHTKANDLIEMSKQIINNFGGTVPGTIEELTTLSGVGRKTANLIVGDVYGKPAVVADTHLIRISNRLGLVNSKDPVKVETVLKIILPENESNDFCHRCVMFGRDVCNARKPDCGNCELSQLCTINK